MYSHAAAGREEAQRRWLRDLADLEAGVSTRSGAYLRNSGCYYLATLKDAEAYEGVGRPGVSRHAGSGWTRNILNVLVLQQILGITEAQFDSSDTVQLHPQPE